MSVNGETFQPLGRGKTDPNLTPDAARGLPGAAAAMNPQVTAAPQHPDARNGQGPNLGERPLGFLQMEGDVATARFTGGVNARNVDAPPARFALDVAVAQKGNNPHHPVPGNADAPQAFEVTVDGHTFERTVGGGTEKPFPGQGLALGRGHKKGDRVTLTFTTKADAARAIDVLNKSEAALALERPAAGRPGDLALRGAADVVRPGATDRAWLQGQVTTTATPVPVNGPNGLAALGIPRSLVTEINRGFNGTPTVFRTTDLENGVPTRTNLEITGRIKDGAKETLEVALNRTLGPIQNEGALQRGAGNGEQTVRLTWAAAPTEAPAARGVHNLVGSTGPDSLDFKAAIPLRDAFSLDPTRTDFRRVTVEARIEQAPLITSTNVHHLLAGDVRNAAVGIETGGRLAVHRETIQQSVTASEPVIGRQDAGRLEISSSSRVDVAAEKITARQPIFATAEAQPQRSAPISAAVAEVATGLVVTPRDGVLLRESPDGGSAGVIQHGAFITQSGDPVTMADGSEWVPVEGRMTDGQMKTGFVSSDYVRLHPMDSGAMDGGARTNPTLEAQGYQSVTARADDTLWDMARQSSVAFNDMVSLNDKHLIKPDLLLEGDRVFLPGTEGTAPVNQTDTARANVVDPASGADASDADMPTTVATDGQTKPVPQDGIGEQSAPVTVESRAETHEQRLDLVNDPIPGSAGGATTVSDPDKAPDTSENSESQAPGPASEFDEISATRPSLETIRAEFQVEGEDGTVDWQPAGDAARAISLASETTPSVATHGMEVRPTEAALLDMLNPLQQVTYFDISSDAIDRAEATYVRPEDFAGDMQRWGSDGHLDAFRHAYWSGRLALEFGEDWTRAYTNAHEASPDNEGTREAMDLYNNGIGIETALANRSASADELATLIGQRLDGGELIVVRADGLLAWSDEVALGAHGIASGGPERGVIPLSLPTDIKALR